MRDLFWIGVAISTAHYCVSCSDGHAKGDGCINCRQTGYDQTPWPSCQECKS